MAQDLPVKRKHKWRPDGATPRACRQDFSEFSFAAVARDHDTHFGNSAITPRNAMSSPFRLCRILGECLHPHNAAGVPLGFLDHFGIALVDSVRAFVRLLWIAAKLHVPGGQTSATFLVPWFHIPALVQQTSDISPVRVFNE